MGSLTQFSVGTEATFKGRICQITDVVGVSDVMIVFKDNGENQVSPVSELDTIVAPIVDQIPHRDMLSDKNRAIANERFEAIKPLLNGNTDRASVQTQANAYGKSVRTIRRWLRAYLNTGRTSSLAPSTPKKRAKRLSEKVEAIIKHAIKTEYLTAQRKTAQKVIDAVRRTCRATKIKSPSANTVRNRLAEISEKKKRKKRHGNKLANERYGQIRGKFPGANWPLKVVQIDHTLLDIIVVDDVYRKPIARPWLTLAIDVYSRMITGYYLSLEHPSTFSVGLCIQHSALKKDRELASYGLKNSWDVWGIMQTLHADNGSDFRSEALKDSCKEYDINISWRPLGKAHWGGHIERMIGTIVREIHALPGTTYSNVQERGASNPEASAVMTLDETREWLVTWITGVYHQKIHSQIKTTPQAMWEKGILGDGKKQKGIGLPNLPDDPDKFYLDFLPFQERAVRRDGIYWDHICYFSEDLVPWIGEKKGGRAMKFRIRRDPRDISRIYFLDPKLGQYVEVPYRDISRPSLTIWEFRDAKKRAKEEGHKNLNEELIFASWDVLDRIIAESVVKTKKARKAQQKKSDALKRLPNRKPKNSPQVKKERTELTVVVDNVPEPQGEDEYFDIGADEIKTGWKEWP